MSFLGWIDFDQADRERAHRIMDLFAEQNAVDELGIGAVRDSLADLMFPGTSTIQTRLRYMLFVPWIYRLAARQHGRPEARAAFARAREVDLIAALERGGETLGVIGSVARAGLKRLPSDVYWNGLGTLGIRRMNAPRGGWFDLSPAEDEAARRWAPGLPEAPDDFLRSPSFRLTPDEAGFLTDRLQAEAGGSLLREMVEAGPPPDCEMPWLHPLRSEFSQDNFRLLGHAQLFSALILGATLLYNLLLCEILAEKTGSASTWAKRTEEFRVRLNDWQEELRCLPIADWDLGDLWRRCGDTIHRVGSPTQKFVHEWREIVLGSADVREDEAARLLIEQREVRLKAGKSRFRNAAARDRWGGSSGTEPLGFRWPQVRSHLNDIADAR